MSRIGFIDIYYIAVKGHYCKLVFNKGGEIFKEYVRLSLKEAPADLSPSQFAQVHRSYAVNLQHVKHIKKRQAYQLYIEGSDHFLPASKHRADTFLTKLKKILNQLLPAAVFSSKSSNADTDWNIYRSCIKSLKLERMFFELLCPLRLSKNPISVILVIVSS